MLESRGHPIDLALADTVFSGFIAPCRDGLTDSLGYFFCFGGVQLKILRDGARGCDFCGNTPAPARITYIVAERFNFSGQKQISQQYLPETSYGAMVVMRKPRNRKQSLLCQNRQKQSQITAVIQPTLMEAHL
jgi:hypothetical protein